MSAPNAKVVVGFEVGQRLELGPQMVAGRSGVA
jgi:hypothetical protein